MRLNPRSLQMSALLTALVAIAPISTDMYLPALPAIGEAFGASTAAVQLTLSFYLVGFAGAQLILGPLSDRYGRRPVLIGGASVFVFASAACYFAADINSLIAARFFQAVGACAGGAVGRAAVRDIYETKDAARLLAHMGTAMAVAPLVAPLLGGQLTHYFGWETNFAALGLFGAIVLALSVTVLPETNTRPDPLALSPRRMIENYLSLARHPDFRAYTLTNAFSFGGLFAFISGASFVLIGTFGLTPQTFGFAFAAPVIGYMIGTQVGARMAKSHSVDEVVKFGSFLGVIAGLIGLVLTAVQPALWTVIIPMFGFSASVGIVMPNSMAGSIGPFPHMAGAASALMGFTQMGMAAGMGALVGLVHDGTALPTMAVIALSGALSYIYSRQIRLVAED
ncbi:multidrug effflux MFS transporter [Magnetovibrio sp. PR-2]|uniref:multidrug effflux MFS transporter n=1 Tax=Magnetovibrio sp. PR-2 TaxID=3120356 RepID=UPI002FCE65E6